MCFQDGSPIKKSDRLITNLDPPAVVEEPATPETNPVEEEPENEPNGDAPSAPEGDFYYRDSSNNTNSCSTDSHYAFSIMKKYLAQILLYLPVSHNTTFSKFLKISLCLDSYNTIFSFHTT